MKQQLTQIGKDDNKIFFCELCRDDETKLTFTFSSFERTGNQIVHCPKCSREETVKINRRGVQQ